MIRIALCDDEQDMLGEVSQYIEKYADKVTESIETENKSKK